jgi:uncharacterized protein (TIGR00251 family)
MAEGVRVEVKVTPRAAATRIGGLADDAAGAKVLKIAVTAPPEDGKANRAVIELLASEWRLPKSAFAVASGAGARRKSVVIAGDADVLLSRLGAWLESRGA